MTVLAFSDGLRVGWEGRVEGGGGGLRVDSRLSMRKMSWKARVSVRGDVVLEVEGWNEIVKEGGGRLILHDGGADVERARDWVGRWVIGGVEVDGVEEVNSKMDRKIARMDLGFVECRYISCCMINAIIYDAM